MRRGLGVLTGALLIAGLLSLGSAHHKPDHQIPPGQQTTTTTVEETTTTTEATTTTTEATTTTTVGTEVINLIENWVITSDDIRYDFIVEANGFEILIDGANLDWDQFEIRNAARVMWHNACGAGTLRNGLIVNSGVYKQIGFYPLHQHLCGDLTRGLLVESTTIRDSNFRAFVPHGSNGITFRNVRAERVFGEAFWWDRPGTNQDCTDKHVPECNVDDSNDIVVDGLFVDGSFWDREEPCCSEFHVFGAVVLGSGDGNAVINSHVQNVGGGANCSGYHWPGWAHSWTFTNNTFTDNNCHGIHVWQNDWQFEHVIDGFTGGGISHGAYTNDYDYRNVDVPYLTVHALGWSMSDSHVDAARVVRHTVQDEPVTFTRVTFGSFAVDDAGLEPGVYHLNETNLACQDIIWEDVHPDSQLFIDGTECHA